MTHTRETITEHFTATNRGPNKVGRSVKQYTFDTVAELLATTIPASDEVHYAIVRPDTARNPDRDFSYVVITSSLVITGKSAYQHSIEGAPYADNEVFIRGSRDISSVHVDKVKMPREDGRQDGDWIAVGFPTITFTDGTRLTPAVQDDGLSDWKLNQLLRTLAAMLK